MFTYKTDDPFEAMHHHSLYQALLTMVKATDAHSRSVLSKWYQNGKADPKAFSKEFRTVRFGLGRRMGHTTMGLKLCEEVAPKPTLFLTLGPNYVQQVRDMRDKTDSVLISSLVLMNFLSKGADAPLEKKINTYKLIVVDLASFASKAKLDKLRSLVTSTPTLEDPGPLFVLLQ